MRRSASALLLLALLASGCARPDPPDAAAAMEEALASHRASLGAIPGANAPSPAARPAGARPAAAASGAPPAPPPAVTAAPVAGQAPTMAGQLVGQPPETVRHWLGAPRLQRDEGAAQVWHYQSADCHLDLILYREEGATPGWRVAFAQARAIGTARRAEATCLREIARGAERRPPDPPVRLAGAA